MIRTAILAAILLLLAACSGEKPVEPPPRITTAPIFAEQTSSVVMPVQIPLARLEQMVNKEIPQTLWTIDRKEDKCVPGQRVTICPAPRRECKNGKCKTVGCKFGLYRTKITPDFSCRIVGQVTRGRIRLSGRGDQVTMVLPLKATLGVRKVAGFLRETATAAADVRMRVRLDVGADWQPTARVEIDHDWREPPGIDFMGKRISFASKADPALQKAFADIERRIQADVAKMPMKARVNEGWQAGFTVIELNRRKPPAFMRVTPRRLSFGGFRVRNRQLELWIGMTAVAETFIGDRPEPLVPIPLPPPDKMSAPQGLAFNIPVVADYDELVPVVDRTLAKLARRGVTIPQLGKMEMQFQSVTIYATEGGRLAIGIPAIARLKIAPLQPTKGIVWLTGRPVNSPGSQRVEVEDLRIFGNTDRDTVNLLLLVFKDPEVLAEIQAALRHDFAPDYERVLKAARAAIASRRFGPFMLRATATDVSNGRILVTGKGLFMPVMVRGEARLSFAPAGQDTGYAITTRK